MGTMIKKCSCQNKYQDEQYGKGMRVHNETTNHPMQPLIKDEDNQRFDIGEPSAKILPITEY